VTDVQIIAHIMAGEGMGCPAIALIAIGHMWLSGRNRTWHGWADPTPEIWMLAYWLYVLPDPTPQARFMFSAADTRLPAVRHIIGHDPPLAVWQCDGGLQLFAY